MDEQQRLWTSGEVAPSAAVFRPEVLVENMDVMAALAIVHALRPDLVSGGSSVRVRFAIGSFEHECAWHKGDAVVIAVSATHALAVLWTGECYKLVQWPNQPRMAILLGTRHPARMGMSPTVDL